ncbi:MAG: S8 family peptidase [Myxococcota bacterium]|nr:S8 family peptidase [Myxococcota bacterium]
MRRRDSLVSCSFGAALASVGLLTGAAWASPPADDAARVGRLVAPGWAPSDGPSFVEAPDAQQTVDDEIALDLRDDVTPEDIVDLANRYGLDLRPNSAWSVTHDKLEVATTSPSREAALLEDLSRDPRVEHAEPMALYRASFVPNDPLYTTKQWHLQRIGAESAWTYTCGRGVTIAVIDTGIACFDKGPFSRGSDLAGTRCEGGWNFVDDSAEAYDDQGHGTHVAGTIAQTTNNGVGTAGVAYCATLMPIKVLNRQGFGSVTNVAEGVRYAADAGAQIINMSLGGPIRSRILQDAVEYALGKGALVVAAAGNSGRSVGWPAAYPGVIAVSATDSDDRIAWFSSRGPEVTLAAPGVAVTQQTVCNGGRDRCEVFGTFNGTSMASPHVAGVAALIEALGVTAPDAVREVLVSSARPKEEKSLYGAGIVDAGAATRHVFWGRFVWRTIALVGLGAAIARRIRKRGGRLVRSPGTVLGALCAAVGVFPAALLFGGVAHADRFRTVVGLLTRPLGEWDIVLVGVGLHRWLLFASALPAIALTMVGFASSRARPLIGGVALGTAAMLVHMAFAGDTAFVAGAFAGRVWAGANALVCVWIARAALDGRRTA